MFWHFDHRYAEPRFWVRPERVREFLFQNSKLPVSADFYRLAFKCQSGDVSERTLMATVIPPQRAAQLICTTLEFDALAKEVGATLLLAGVKGVKDAAARARLRAELDGLVAHIYGLTESEFTHVLSASQLAEDVKAATLTAYRELAPKPR
ncbi:hypothetical protein SBV1_810002 [Verrucomicrobia bacterium]|nr:hypothetical protein SBV1_810002 [Verrucomicrobiota bacterium]